MKYNDVWPIDKNAGNPPPGWTGWPDNKRFALVLTHDVDTIKGYTNCLKLVNLEKELGFRSAFYFIPRGGYNNNFEIQSELINSGFEVGVHGLKHDGKLYFSRNIFQQRAARINAYLAEWQAVGFRSPCMHHNLDWLHDLNIDYDASTYDTDPFEPQGGGTGTIFPFVVRDSSSSRSYVELSYTLPQDHLLYVIMKKKSIDVWKDKLDWIAENGGMALLISHPDYMCFDSMQHGNEEFPVDYYKEFLQYVKSKYKDQYWPALPREIAKFWSDKQ